MKSQEIEQYLAELGAELKSLGIRTKLKPSSTHLTCFSDQKVRVSNDAENYSNNGMGLPTNLCRRRPLDCSWELY